MTRCRESLESGGTGYGGLEEDAEEKCHNWPTRRKYLVKIG